MIRLASLLVGALACAAPLAAQDIPLRPTLLRVAEGSDGTVLALDSAAIAHTGDSTFVVNAVYHFAPDTVRKVDGKMELQVMDCGRARTRGRYISWFVGNTPIPVQDDSAGRTNAWRPVEEAELPIFRAICTYLLGSFAAALPVTAEALDSDEPWAIVNREEVARALARGYPRRLRDTGLAGTALLRVRIGAEGQADPATLRVLWATHPDFAGAALAVARRARWRPVQVDGQPAAVWALLPINFYLQQ